MSFHNETGLNDNNNEGDLNYDICTIFTSLDQSGFEPYETGSLNGFLKYSHRKRFLFTLILYNAHAVSLSLFRGVLPSKSTSRTR